MILFGMVSCDTSINKDIDSNSLKVETFIATMESDLQVLEEEIIQLAQESQILFDQKDSLIALADQEKFKFSNGVANMAPNADPNLSTVYISKKANDLKEIMDLVYLTESIDPKFKSIVEKYKVVSQVYFNSSLQMNRLYPPYDAGTMLTEDLDLTSFNFYYEASGNHNPSKGPVWVNEIYLDPVGKGWMISLIHPVYHEGELKMVLGFDITVSNILKIYMDQFDNQMVIIDETGTVVTGRAKALEMISLPPLTSAIYNRSVTSDEYRKAEYNLLKSKSSEIRNMAENILQDQKNEFLLKDGKVEFKVKAFKMNKLNWYILDLQI